jgi:hypothetical protein
VIPAASARQLAATVVVVLRRRLGWSVRQVVFLVGRGGGLGRAGHECRPAPSPTTASRGSAGAACARAYGRPQGALTMPSTILTIVVDDAD